jgi:hypothetical protein
VSQSWKPNYAVEAGADGMTWESLEKHEKQAIRMMERLAVEHTISLDDVLRIYEASGCDGHVTKTLVEMADHDVSVDTLLACARMT